MAGGALALCAPPQRGPARCLVISTSQPPGKKKKKTERTSRCKLITQCCPRGNFVPRNDHRKRRGSRKMGKGGKRLGGGVAVSTGGDIKEAEPGSASRVGWGWGGCR